MSTVTREHREAALSLLYTNPVSSEVKWLETGLEPEDSHAGIARAKRVAQALAAAESAAYARGLADGAERERAAVARFIRGSWECCKGPVALDIEAGKHLEGSE